MNAQIKTVSELWAMGETVRSWDLVLERDRKAFALEIVRGLLAGQDTGRTRQARAHVERVMHYLVYSGLQQAERSRAWRASEVAIHIVQMVVAVRLWPEVRPETARKRVQTALRRLSALGLVRYSGHRGNMRSKRTGGFFYDGTLVRVRLRPGRVRAFMAEDFSHPWRDLAADVAAGRVAKAVIHRMVIHRRGELSHTPNEGGSNSTPTPSQGVVAPTGDKDPLVVWETSRPRRAQLRDAVLDLDFVETDRHLAVDRVARMIADALSDQGSLRYFAGLIWRYLRAGRLHALAQQLERLLANVEEGGVGRPGALLAARMGRLAA